MSKNVIVLLKIFFTNFIWVFLDAFFDHFDIKNAISNVNIIINIINDIIIIKYVKSENSYL